MYVQISSKKRRISDLFAIAGLILLSIDTTNTFIGQGTYGFSSPLNDQQSGLLFGIPSVILFFLAFAVGFRQRSRLTTLLLISGGALLATSKLVEPTLGLNLFLAIVLRPLYLGLILMGFVILGLGVSRILQRDAK